MEVLAPNPRCSEPGSRALVATITWTAIVSIACFVPTFVLWGSSSGFWLPYFFYPLPCLVGEALGILLWPHGELFLLAMVLFQMPAYGSLIRISWSLGRFRRWPFALLALHIIAIILCFLLAPLRY